MDYILHVDRPEGLATAVYVQVNGIYLTFKRGMDGKPYQASRSRGAMINEHSSQYIPKWHYSHMIRQVYSVFNEKRKCRQLGFVFPGNEA